MRLRNPQAVHTDQSLVAAALIPVSQVCTASWRLRSRRGLIGDLPSPKTGLRDRHILHLHARQLAARYRRQVLEGTHLVDGHDAVGEHLLVEGGARRAVSAQQALQADFRDNGAQVIAKSYGAYLLLFAQSLMPAFPGKVLLLSPVIGAVTQSSIGKAGFAPPYAERLMVLARLGELVVPRHCEIHVGANDWQCPAERLSDFGRLTGVPVTIVLDAGHMLDHNYVKDLLDRWLTLEQ